jgi:beta-xylosidase
MLCVLLLVVLAGCDAGGSNNQSTPTTAPQPTVAVTPTSSGPAATPTLTAVPTPGPDEFHNPVLEADFPDPFVLKDGDTYYAYATNAGGKNVQLARSTDLVKWEMLTDAMPGFPSWAKLGGSFVWAPEVMKNGDKYVLYITARDKASNRQCVGVATADSPEGKFLDTSDKPLVCQADEGGTIDASPFRDGDKLYLYFKNDGNCCNKPTFIYVQELAPDGLSLVGEATRLVRNDHAWEGAVVEAPTMWKHEGKYYLFFSANSYSGFQYAVGYANCQSPTGPCEDAPENPILASRMDAKPLVVGPGHQSIIEHNGQTWLVYHVWEVTSAGLRGSARDMWIDRLTWEDGKPHVQGPTTGPQPRP